MINLFKKMYRIRNHVLCVFSICAAFSFIQPNSVDAALSKPSNNLGLVGYWSFNDATSTIATDFSGNGNTGTLTNMANPATATSGWGNGKLGSGLNFDGTNDYVDTGDNTTLNFGAGDFAISTWVFNDNQATSDIIVGKDNSSARQFVFALNLSCATGTVSAGSICAMIASSNSAQYYVQSSAGVLSPNAWHHVMYMRSAGVSSIWIDGVSVAITTSSTGGALSSLTLQDATSQMWIGARQFTSYQGYFSGKIDEVRIYSRALSATEITSLYNAGAQKLKLGASNNGLVGYWSFNDATSTIATDFSGNGNTGTLTNMANPATATSGWGNGKLGGGLNFDGVNDKVITGSGPNLTNTATFSFWVKTSQTEVQALNYPISLGSSGSNRLSVYVGGLYSDGQIAAKSIGLFDGTNSSSAAANSFTSADYGRWHHIVVTYDKNASTKTQIYKDGVALAMVTSNISGILASQNQVSIGARADGFFNWNGSIDEVRIYNRALSAAEVAGLYTSGAQKINASRNVTGSSLDSGLVGLWSFDGKDLNGTTAYDRSGQGNNGTLTNGPVPAIGKMGQALSFDGANDTATASNYNLSAYSVCFWIKNPVAPSTANTIQPIVNGNADPVWGLSWSHTDPTFKQAFFQELPNSSFVAAQLTSTLQVNTWYHVCGTYDGANLKAYLNAVNQATVPVTSVKVPTGTFTFSRVSGGNTPFGGSIDDVRIYNRALTVAEVKALYNLGK